MKIEYTIPTPSVMKVTVNAEKQLRILGEGTTTPIFYAYRNSMLKWEPPYDDIFLTEDEKDYIIATIEEMSKFRIKVIFE